MNYYDRFRIYVSDLFAGDLKHEAATVTAIVDDSPGWQPLTGRPHDLDPSQVFELYQDALEAWRKNPLAFRITGITTDYVVGDNIEISSSIRPLNKFIDLFWNHPKNLMALRLESMCDELSRAGDLFVLLFRNDQDGMSYIRFVTKDRIVKIDTAANDWETELIYYEQQDIGDPKAWYSPDHPSSINKDAVMLHYSVNRVIGAILGEGDLSSMIPWLQRYSRMLEDRVRLHWAVRAFLWIVTVPSSKVKSKQEQYRTPPESGNIIVKDEGEEWEVKTPTLRGADASYDLLAVRGMIDAGSGYPPHWRGESGEANLATATAMQAPTERHLLRRQNYFIYVLQDILYKAYQRGVETDKFSKLRTNVYSQLFTISAPDISRSDNEILARSVRDVIQGFSQLNYDLPGQSESYIKQMLRTAFKFSGEPQTEDVINQIYKEATDNPGLNVPTDHVSDNPND
jgi:hypothetical protein